MWYAVNGLYPLIRNHAALEFGFDRQWRRRRLKGMKQILVMIAAAVLVGCGKKDLPEPQAKTPETPKAGVN